jgi:hypothetical protein
MRRTLSLAVVMCLTLCAYAGTAQAAILTFEAVLDGAQETPPVATPGTGDGTLTLDDSTGGYTIAGNFQNLIGTTNNAHIHGPAPPGTPAGVIHGLTFDFGVTTGTYSGANTFTAAQMADLIAGLYYVNIHTTYRPGGEIRGQLIQTVVPEPGSVVLFGLGGLAALAIAWRRRRAR